MALVWKNQVRPGVEIRPHGKPFMIYKNGDRTMQVEVERFSKGPSHVLYPSTILAWQPPYEKIAVSEGDRKKSWRISSDSSI